MALTHYLRRGQQLASLGLIARRLGSAEKSQNAELEIASRMASMHGLPQKIGQILSMSKLQLAQNPLHQLSESSPGMSPELAFRLIEEQLKRPLGDVCESIEENCFAASLGQVHKARLRDGTPVALKIQYPDISSHLEIDLQALGLLAVPLSFGKTSGFNLDSYRDELRQSLLREIDYSLELSALSRMKCHLEGFDEFLIPGGYRDLSSQTLLVMDWIGGKSLLDAGSLELSTRKELAVLMLRFLLLSWLQFGEIHADPHPGNFRYILDSDSSIRLGILDFGCTRILSLDQRRAFYQLLKNCFELSAESQLELYVQLGFDRPLLSCMTSKLPQLSQLLFLPFHQSEDFDLDSWRLSERIEELLDEDRWNFRFAGPATLLGFVRAFSGSLQYLKAFDVCINWKEFLEHIEQGFDTTPLELPFDTVKTSASQASLDNSRIFCIEVRESGALKARLRFTLKALSNLAELMPDDLLKKLEAQQIYPQVLADKCIQDGYPSGLLFQFEEQPKQVRVWLE